MLIINRQKGGVRATRPSATGRAAKLYIRNYTQYVVVSELPRTTRIMELPCLQNDAAQRTPGNRQKGVALYQLFRQGTRSHSMLRGIMSHL